MEKAKKHVEFSESVKGERKGDDLLNLQTSKKRSKRPSRLGSGRIFIPAHSQSGSELSPPVESPSPFSPAFSSDSSTGGVEPSAGQNHDRDLPLDELTGNGRKRYRKQDMLAPEAAITLFAFRLAILEKIASTLGTVAFLWATVVLLGGFATTAKITDFWVVSVLLFTEGMRIFGRSHELEWQHVASKATRTLTSSARRATSQVYKIGSDAVHLSSRVVRTAFLSLIHKPEDAEHGVDLAAVHTHSEVKVKEETIPIMQKSSSAPPFIRRKGPDEAINELKLSAALPGGGNATKIKRTWSTDIVPFIPYAHYAVFSSQAISLYLYWLQIASACSGVGLSIWRLWMHDYTDAESEMSLGSAADNLVLGLVLFYGLALAESFVFLFERAYWELKLNYENLLVKVSDEYKLPGEMQPVVKDFFYDVYRKSLDGSIFDGLEMDMVTFAIQLVQSDSSKLQLQGSQLMVAFVKDPLSAEETVRRISSSPGMFDRLVEMLSWHNEDEEQIRTAAAEIVCRVVIFNRNTFRIAGIAGAMEGIVCLLHEQDLRKGTHGLETSESALKLRLLGLRILKYLSRDHNNRARIGDTRGLLPTLVTLIQVKSTPELGVTDGGLVVKCFKKSLQLLILMASAPGRTGERLRASILQVITTVRNIRDILQYGSEHPMVQKYAVDLITYLAMNDDAQVRRSLGSTGGLIRNLLALLLVKKSWSEVDPAHPDGPKREDSPLCARRKFQIRLAVDAGEALNLLALKNQTNCRRMICVKDLETGEPIPTLQQLMDLVSDPHLGATASKILRSFCQYAGSEDQATIANVLPVALAVVRRESDKHQEAALGLAAKSLQLVRKLREPEDVRQVLDNTFIELGVDKKTFVQEIILLIRPKTHLPRLRRHVVELVNALVESDTFFVTEFREAGLERKLHQVLDTIWDIENFYIFAGNTGIARHEQDMEALVWSALDLLGSPIPTEP